MKKVSTNPNTEFLIPHEKKAIRKWFIGMLLVGFGCGMLVDAGKIMGACGCAEHLLTTMEAKNG